MIKKNYRRIVPVKQRIQTIQLFRQLTAGFYKGNNVTCNCCGRSFQKFLSKRNLLTKRANAQCPYCGSLESTRLLLFYIENESTLLTNPSRLLHFAPEIGLMPIFKTASNLDYVTADIASNYADYCVDISNIPFCEESFDYIICSHVLRFVLDEKKAIQELYRILKPQGTALVLTLIDVNNPCTFETNLADSPETRLQSYMDADACRLHGADFSQRLQEGGFQVEIIDYAANLGEEKRKKYALGNGMRELIFKCTK